MTSKHRQLPDRFVLTDALRDIDPFQQLAQLKPTDIFILRHYEWAPRDRLALAHTLRKESRARGVRFLVAGDYRLACEARADGLHLPSWMVRRGDVWGLRRKPGWIIIAAAHSEPELRAAWLTGADAALLSPVFATASHPSARTLGVIRFARLAVSAAMPVYALGGVTLSSQKRLSKVANLTGYATVSAV